MFHCPTWSVKISFSYGCNDETIDRGAQLYEFMDSHLSLLSPVSTISLVKNDMFSTPLRNIPEKTILREDELHEARRLGEQNSPPSRMTFKPAVG